jgi:hypothetical protein
MSGTGCARRVFLDIDSLTQWDHGVIQRFPQAVKVPLTGLEPGPAGSWDARTTTSWGTCMKDDGLFRFWYSCMADAKSHEENCDVIFIAYAESEDGIHWRKPDLKLTAKNRYPGSNLLPLPGVCCGVVHALPGSDFKYLAACISIAPLEPDITEGASNFQYRGSGTYLYTSDDGLHWQQLTESPLMTHGDIACLYADQATGRYLLYQKCGGTHGLVTRRGFIGLESRDGIHWEGYDGIRKWRECFFADDFDDFIASQRGYLVSDYYGVSIYRAGEILVSVEDLFTIGSPLRQMFGQNPSGFSHLRLGFSHDGMHWRHPKGRPAWLELGEPGEFDAGFFEISSTLVEHGDDLLLYYDGMPYIHDAFINPDFSMRKDLPLAEQRGFQRIGLAKMRKDRFASLAATYRASFDVDAGPRKGEDLFINASSPRGAVRVAIAEQSDPYHGALRKSDFLPGFSFDDCVPFTGDSTSAPVRFKNASVADIPRDKHLCLRFEMHKGEVFAYEWK